jgi:hypothetical protein
MLYGFFTFNFPYGEVGRSFLQGNCYLVSGDSGDHSSYTKENRSFQPLERVSYGCNFTVAIKFIYRNFSNLLRITIIIDFLNLLRTVDAKGLFEMSSSSYQKRELSSLLAL